MPPPLPGFLFPRPLSPSASHTHAHVTSGELLPVPQSPTQCGQPSALSRSLSPALRLTYKQVRGKDTERERLRREKKKGGGEKNNKQNTGGAESIQVTKLTFLSLPSELIPRPTARLINSKRWDDSGDTFQGPCFSGSLTCLRVERVIALALPCSCSHSALGTQAKAAQLRRPPRVLPRGPIGPDVQQHFGNHWKERTCLSGDWPGS